jgi:hypothetical protein
MSASQQASDFQTDLQVAAAAQDVLGEEAQASANRTEAQFVANQVPEVAIRAIVDGYASDDDLQPMLDLRFPDEPLSAQPDPEVQSQLTKIHAESEIELKDTGEVAPHTSIEPPSATTTSRPWIEVDLEGPVAFSSGASDVDEAKLAEEIAEDTQQPSAVTELSEGEQRSTPEPQNAPSVTAFDSHEPSAVETVRPQADAAPSPDGEHHETAAQKIAAEASATAEALESLKRLLIPKMPLQSTEGTLERPPFLQAPPPPALREMDHGGQEPSRREEPVLQPHPVPSDMPTLPQDVYQRRRGFEVRGFLAGFALSWALGAALYVYLLFS